jgi:protein-disulfide isomerase
MALPPKFAAHRLTFASPKPAVAGIVPGVHTIEVFIDYVCPYSAKIFATLYNSVIPIIKENSSWASSLEIIFRQQVQPWHPSSTLTHEAALAVLKVSPEKFWPFSAALFEAQKEYFDVNVVNEGRNQTYARLAKLAGSVGVDEQKVLDLLTVSDNPSAEGDLNLGNGTTNDLKVLIKMARLVSVHVSPTVIFDGVVQNDISSGWSVDQWKEWLTKSVV